MIKTIVICAGLLFAQAACAAGPVFDPGLGVILPAKNAGELVEDCSTSPKPKILGGWTPSSSEIRQLELRLPDAIRESYSKLANQRGLAPSYARQYGGVIVPAGRRIYVKGFRADLKIFYPKSAWTRIKDLILHQDTTPFVTTLMVAEPEWRNHDLKSCGGGTGFFTASYDPITKRFDELYFNGPL